MPKLKREIITYKPINGIKAITIEVDIFVNAAGEFYAPLPPEFETYFKSSGAPGQIRVSTTRANVAALFAHSLGELTDELTAALAAINEPIIVEEPVIRYNITSKVAFAVASDGAIRPNASFDDASWVNGRSSMFGNLSAQSPAPGGYSLTIGAKALLKRTTTMGSQTVVDYQTYYESESHHGHSNPAQLLNSWCSFNLPDTANEIPYSREAALFFHNLMLGMASLSKLIMEETFDQSELLSLIESNSPPLLTTATS